MFNTCKDAGTEMDSSKALEMDYLLCDILKITMEELDEVPLPIVIAWRKTAAIYARDLYEEELLMNLQFIQVR